MANTLKELETIGKDRNPIQESEYQGLLAKLPPPVDLSAGVNKAASNTAAIGGLLGSQAAQGNDWLSRFTSMLGSQEGSAAMAKRLGAEAGLPQLNANAFNAQQQLYNLPTTYKNAVIGTDTNANQLDRVINTKTAELSPLAQRAQENANNAKSSVDTQMGYAQKDQDRALIPFQAEKELMSERQAREVTGYTTAWQSELDAIVSKMQMGVQISEGEKNRAHELAMAEQAFERQKEMFKMESEAGGTDNGYMTLSEGQTVYDPKTGRSLYTAGKTYAPSSSGGTGGNPIGAGSTRGTAGF